MNSAVRRIVNADDFTEWGKLGIRSQLLNRKTGQLEMCDISESDDNVAHVLNAVLPGWTSSLSLAEYV